MTDPSFILRGPASSELRELARDLQALIDIRTAAMQQPVSVSVFHDPNFSDWIDLSEPKQGWLP